MVRMGAAFVHSRVPVSPTKIVSASGVRWIARFPNRRAHWRTRSSASVALDSHWSAAPFFTGSVKDPPIEARNAKGMPKSRPRAHERSAPALPSRSWYRYTLSCMQASNGGLLMSDPTAVRRQVCRARALIGQVEGCWRHLEGMPAAGVESRTNSRAVPNAGRSGTDASWIPTRHRARPPSRSPAPTTPDEPMRVPSTFDATSRIKLNS